MQARKRYRCLGFVSALLMLLATCGGTEVQQGDLEAEGESILIAFTLMSLSGEEFDLSHNPIPKSISVVLSLSTPLSDEQNRETLEASVSLLDPSGASCEGSFTWSEDYSSVTFKPSRNLDYSTSYTVTVNNSVLPIASLGKSAVSYEAPFTTMSRRDYNGDGYSDVIVGADNYPAGARRGRTYIFNGSANGITDCDLATGCTADTVLEGANDNNKLGHSVFPAGDVNGDGYEDAIVSAKRHPANEGPGRVYLFMGSADGIADCALSAPEECTSLGGALTGLANGDEFGYCVSTAGDVNGDGYDDVIVGAAAYPGGDWSGAAYVFLGSASGIADCDISAGCEPHATIIAAEAAGLGSSCSSAGDVNGDGYDEVIIGAYRGVPKAFIFRGSSEGISNCDLSSPESCSSLEATIIGLESSSLGAVSAVTGGGDLNGDGYDDVAAGAGSAPSDETYRGQAYVFYGSAEGIQDFDLSLQSANSTITGDIDYAVAGVSICDDIDGDGYDDLIVGASGGGAIVKDVDRGRAFVFHGSSDGVADCDISAGCSPPTTITGEKDLDWLGFRLSGTGDINGDGYADIIVSSPRAPADPEEGKVYIFLGSESGIDSCNLGEGCPADTTLIGEHDDDYFANVI